VPLNGQIVPVLQQSGMAAKPLALWGPHTAWIKAQRLNAIETMLKAVGGVLA